MDARNPVRMTYHEENLESLTDIVTGCIHSPHASRVLLDYIVSLVGDHSRIRFTLIGDLTAHPWENPLRSMKRAAEESGIDDYVALEEGAWKHSIPFTRRRLIQNYRQGYDGSMAIIHNLSQIVQRGLVLGKITDTGGNDYDKVRRIMRAERQFYTDDCVADVREEERKAFELRGKTPWIGSPRQDLSQIIENLDFVRTIKGVEFDVAKMRGEDRWCLFLRLPYLADKKPGEVDGYLREIAEAIGGSSIASTSIPPSDIAQVILQGHNNPHQMWRKEKNIQRFKDIYGLIRTHFGRVFKEGNVAHISAHTHYTPDKYSFEGVWQFCVGYGDSTSELSEAQKNLYASTGGFRAIRSSVLEVIDLSSLDVKGYAFQVSFLDAIMRRGFVVQEIPIAFHDRSVGESKMGLGDIIEVATSVLRIAIARAGEGSEGILRDRIRARPTL